MAMASRTPTPQDHAIQQNQTVRPSSSILNPNPQLLPGPKLLHSLLHLDESSRADQPALECLSPTNELYKYSYCTLHVLVQNLATKIRKVLRDLPANIQTQQIIIPVLIPQSPALYISQFAVLQTGAAFCPINLDAPAERIKFISKDVNAKIIISTREFEDVLRWDGGPEVIFMEGYPAVPGLNGEISEQSHVLQHDAEIQGRLAYVMYTSGSTGQPKGVAISHFAVTQSLLAHDRHIPTFRRFLQFAAPSFDVSVFEIFFPLFRGATLVGCDRSKLLNDLCGIINTLNIDAAELTPTVAGSLVQKRERVPRLKLLLTIGEMLTNPVVKEFGANHEEGREGILYGMYGPTEAAIHCTVNPLMTSSSPVSNIGIPFDVVTAFIAKVPDSDHAVDIPNNAITELEILDFGEVGELILAGPQLAEGYLNRPEQNAAAFITYNDKPAYRTGDKARVLRNGTIEMIGRIASGQVKLRGQRVELGEIEQAIFKHDDIQAAFCSVLNGILVSFVRTSNPSTTVESIQETCKQWLPQFMIPSEIIALPEFPYLPSGKIDRKKLQADYEVSRLESDSTETEELSEIEHQVSDALKEIFGARIAKTARLASAGLDSLRAIQLRSKLADVGLRISPVEILGAENVEALAASCERGEPNSLFSNSFSEDGQILNFYSKDGTTSDLMKAMLQQLPNEIIDAAMPCTPLQLAMLSETARNRSAYQNWVKLYLNGFSNLDRLIDAINLLAQKNEILRTGFVETPNSNDGLAQVVFKNLKTFQVVKVQEFSYDSPKDDNYLQRPLRIQILSVDSGFTLLLHMHHAMYDAWSLELMLDDLDLLLARPEEQLTHREPFSVIVSDFLARANEEKESQQSIDYWEAHLSQLGPLPLPNFRTLIEPSPGFEIAQLDTSISTKGLEAAARELGVSSQSFFQAAFAILLSSYVGSTDVCIGTVFSGRTLSIPGIEKIVGPCLATLPVRIDIGNSSSRTIQSLVQKLNSINRQHIEHSALPLRDIKKACGADPATSLFDTLLVWQQTLRSPEEKRNVVEVVGERDYLEFSLTLEITPGPQVIHIKANYQRTIFPAEQVDLLLRQLESLVAASISKQGRTLEDTYFCLDDQLLSIDNANIHYDPPHKTLASDVESIAAQDPNRPAIEFARSINGSKFDSDRATYGTLNAQANQIAECLVKDCNVLPDELVCICTEKSVSLYASILAVVKAGAGYLPITPDTPLDRIRYILGEAKVKCVLAQSSHPLEEFGNVKVIYVDHLDFSSQSTRNPPSRSLPENLAYAVFTSGSTGTPKGVLVTQGNLVSNLDVLQEMYPADQNTRLLQSCSQAFDVSVFEIFFTWRIGGCLCSATKNTLFLDIENAIRILTVSHLSLTPTVASLIDPNNVPSVQFLVTAGEAVTEKVKSLWQGRGLWQGYGPSETTNICTIRPQVSSSHFINNIGPALSNTSTFVLRPHSSSSAPDEFIPVPRGGDGEFCFGGTQVFRGYLNSQQNIGRIIMHPKYGKLYRSGDFGRILPDGSLAFTGRKDDQVKIRGQRVELGEINRTMLREELVKDCVTLVVDGDTGQQRLISFWTTASEKSNEQENFRSFMPQEGQVSKLFDTLEASLPAYMVPSSLILVSILPSTTQGKIDKRRLISHYNSLSPTYINSTSKADKPVSDYSWTDLDLKVVAVVANIAKVTQTEISPETSFFGLGIDSISAIQVTRKLRESGIAYVEISDVLKYPSVARLSKQITRKSSSHLANSISPMGSSSEDLATFKFDDSFIDRTVNEFKGVEMVVVDVLPCTPLQEAMLSAAENGSSTRGALYSNHVILDVNGNWNHLYGALSTLVSRREILRTCFVRSNHPRFAYAQVVLSPETCKGNFHLLEDLDENASVEALVRAMEIIANARGPYQPAYTFGFTKSSRTGSVGKLVISMHHALYDGVAMGLLFEETERLYRRDYDNLPKPISFKPFLNYMTSVDVLQADIFWDGLLKSFLPTPFPELLASSSLENDLSGSIRLNRTSKISLSLIEGQIQNLKTSLLALCQAAWAGLLSTYLHETDICFGNVISGRSVPVDGVEKLIAPCFNTIPVRLLDLQKLSYLESFRRLQAINAGSLTYQLTPLRRIQSRNGPEGAKLFDTLLILQQPSRELDDEIWRIKEDLGEMDVPIVCEVVQDKEKDQLGIVIHARRNLVSEENAEVILTIFENILTRALQAPSEQITDLSFLENKLFQFIPRSQNIGGKKSSANGVADDQSALSKNWSNTEADVRNVLAEFAEMPLERIQKSTSIFRLGLDSISAVQVAAQLRQKGYQILASDILQRPTIAKIAAHLDVSRGASQSPTPESFSFNSFADKHMHTLRKKLGTNLSGVIEKVRPCTPAQSGMIAQTLHSGGKDYINGVWMELLPDTNLKRLKQAWEGILRRHEMLRTGFVQVDDPTFPFVMVTFAAEYRTIWQEGNVESEPSDVSQMLQERPWGIRTFQNGTKISIHLEIHHALYDAQSLHLILSDVIKAYNSSTGDISSRAPIDPLIEAIITASTTKVDEQQSFWSSEENKLPITKFPDLTPLRLKSSASKVMEKKCSLTFKQLGELCKQQNVTLQAAGQAAWSRLLSAYCGESVVTFGVTLSGRSISTIEGAENIAFPSIVTLPVRCEIDGSNGEVLAKTMALNGKLSEFQFTPLSAIQRWSGYPEGKIFDTLFAFQKLASSPSAQNAWKNTLWEVTKEEAAVDYAVSIELEPTSEDELLFRLTFKESLVPNEHAKLILQQFDLLLKDLLQEPGRPSADVPRAGNEVLAITPAREPTIMIEKPVMAMHQFVEQRALSMPNNSAFEFATNLQPGQVQKNTWTYKQLNEESNRVAHMLLASGVEQGSLVGICFDKCPEAAFAILGILKSGCSYVALDPTAPIDRLEFILKDSEATMVLTAGTVADKLRANDTVKIVSLDKFMLLEQFEATSPELPRPVSGQDTCYCLYTSGTTGTPKGCEITHENAVQAMLAFQRLFAGHWQANSKWLQFASFHFDVSVLELFWSWSVGICVTSAPRDLIFEDIPSAIRELGVTHIDLTPSLARLLTPDDVPSLCRGVFITGGESLKQEILDNWGEKCVIYNGYGPTEATIGVTMYPRVPVNGNPANIGPQFDNVGSFVLKPGTSEPVLRGAIGELCVSGKLVGKGYLKRPELTKERFAFLENFKERVYRTGDLVRILHNGDFIFLGRADDQVKLRGQRLELSEINEVMKKDVDGLKQVSTLVLKHAKQQKEQLVTFFVPCENSEFPSNSFLSGSQIDSLISQMRAACRSRLPGYMVPTHFLALEKFPLNANNKTDNKVLTKMYNELTMDSLQSLTNSSNNSRAWTDAEMGVVKSLSEVFQMESQDLTRDMNIFQLGIDSITVIGLTRKLQNAGFANAKLVTVMSTPAIGDLVEKMLTGRSESDSDTGRDAYLIASQKIAAFGQMHIMGAMQELGVEREEIECVAPCTPLQEGMIFQFLESEKPVYVTGFDFELGADVDVERLKRAWKIAIQKVEILRTRFVMTSDGAAQVVIKSNDLNWRLRQGLDEGGDMVWRTNIHRDYCAMLKKDISGSPFEVTVVEGCGRKIMSLQIFHAIYDGNSLPMILRLISNEYSGTEIQPSPSFHAVLPHGPLASARGAKEYWQGAIQPPRNLMMPSLTTQTSTKSVSVSSTVIGLKVEKLAHGLNSTSQAVLQAAWASVLCSYLAQGRVTFGMVLSGRVIDFEDADQVIGPLFNTVPFQVEIKPTTTWTSLIQDCHAYNTNSLPYQHTPLREIQKWCGNGMNQPIFDTLFVFQHDTEPDDLIVDNMWIPLPETEHNADYLLNLEARLKENGDIELLLVGQGSIVDEVVIAEMLEKLDAALIKLQDLESFVNTDISSTSPSSSNSEDSYVMVDGSMTPSSSVDGFIWTDDAKIIRSEIVSLAQLEDENVEESKSIFEFGLDSIDVIKLSSRLKKKHVNIPVSIIIKCQNIAKMAEYLSSQALVNSSELPEKTIKEYDQTLREYLRRTGNLPSGGVSVLPATPIQEAMIAEMINSNYTRYFNHEILKLGASVDLDILKSAWMKVIDESEILRTSFVEIDETEISTTFAQIVHHRRETDVWQTCTTCKSPGFDTIIDKVITKAKKGGPLLQLILVNDEPDNYLIFSIAHALYDGASLQMLHEDVWKAYNGMSISRPDHKVVFQQILNTNEIDATNFWKTSLSGSPIASFPQNSENLPEIIHRSEQASTLKIQEIQTFCKRLGISLQTLGQTCWALILASYLKRLDVVFGSVLSCRDTEEANEMMFPFMNTVALRSIIHGTLAEMLQYMQESGIAIRQYQHFPLRKAQALAGAGGRLFDTLFIYQGRQHASVDDSQSLYNAVGGASEVEYSVCVEMEVVGDELVWRTACKDSALSASETSNLLLKLDQVLNTMINNPQMDSISSRREGLSICGQSCFQKASIEANPVSEYHSKQEDAAPWSATEKTIRAIVSKVSQVPENEISREQSIYNLGLDSISAIKVSSLLRREGLRLTVGNIVKHSTISAMANAATLINNEAPVSLETSADDLDLDLQNIDRDQLVSANGLNSQAIESILPLSAGQQYMFRRWQESKGTLFYPTFEYRIAGFLDKHRMEIAWKKLQSQLPILRTLILENSNQDIPLVQIVLRECNNPIVQLSHDELVDHYKRIKSYEPLVSLLLRAGDATTQLYLQIHHSLYDGVSLPLIIQQLQDLYNGSLLTDTKMAFPDFLAKNSASKWRSVRQIFWKSYLENKTNNLALFEAQYSNESDTRSEVFEPGVLKSVSELKSQARQIGVSVEALILAAFAKVHARNSLRKGNVIFGIYLANRTHDTEDFSTLPAPTLNLLPLLVKNASSPTSTLRMLAKEIQTDLQKLSQPEIVGTSLKEIYEWTGVRVNCFVNILRLPLRIEPEEGVLRLSGGDRADVAEGISIVENDMDWKESVRVERKMDRNYMIEAPEGSCDAYLSSVDVELGVVGDALNVGVFAPTFYMSFRDAEGVVERLKEELNGVLV